MIDLLRVGGITRWLKIAGMGEACTLPVVTRLGPEIHVPIEHGPLVVRRRPGLGVALDAAAITRDQIG